MDALLTAILSYLFFFFFYSLLIWLLQVLAVAHGVFRFSMWDLVPWPGHKPWPPHWERGVLASGLPGKSFSYLSYLWPLPLQVIVQNYNSILTLSHLYRSSDALLVHENDAVHKICVKLMNIKQVSFCDINQVLAHQLGSVFQPTYSGEGLFHYRRNPLGICVPVGYL